MTSDTTVLAPPLRRPTPPPPPPSPTHRRQRVLGRPLGEVAALAALLLVTAVAYLWNLTASGYANSFYAAAVQAGTRSWKAFFFGSIDSSNFITVDKPPASLWVMELSGRIFGFSPASMLVPQVLEGVATVALVYAIVRRWFGHRLGLLAGALTAVTPVAALMFRFNNPDALLVLLLTAAAYCIIRAVEGGSTRWVALAGAAVGLAFLAKMGQALLVVPALGAVYLLAGPPRLRRRIGQLTAGLVAMIAAAGWWVLIVTLWPASSRPMIDGSPTNSIWNLIVGYNGLDRVVSSGGGAGGGTGFSGATGPLRLFNSLMGGQASWLLPAALVALAAGLVVTARRPRTDRTRAALILWGGWLVVTGLVFSFGQGTIHTYYAVALAPPIAALVAVGAGLAARSWTRPVTRVLSAGVVGATAWWAWVLLDRTPAWSPWLRPLILIAGVLALASTSLSGRGPLRWRRAAGGAMLVTTAVATLSGPLAYTVQAIRTAHTGSVPSAGPATLASAGGPGGGPSSGSGRPAGSGPGPGGTSPSGAAPGGSSGPGAPQPGSAPSGSASAGTGAPGATGGGSGAAPSGSSGVSAALVGALRADASKYRWVAATDGSQSAASLELATGGDPVMAIGGFNNQGGNLTLARFEKYVAEGRIHYYIASGGSGGGPGGGSSASAITSWVESHFESRTIGGTTVYDLTVRTS